MLSPQQKGRDTKLAKYGPSHFKEVGLLTHINRGFNPNHKERFMQMVQVDQVTGCWNWQGGKDKNGYGFFTVEGKQYKAHRWIYEHTNGPIPEGLVIDHLCRNHSCVNPSPDHLEPVTNRENVARGVGFAAHTLRTNTCINGHPLEGDNLKVYQGRRFCLTCLKKRGEETKLRKLNSQDYDKYIGPNHLRMLDIIKTTGPISLSGLFTRFNAPRTSLTLWKNDLLKAGKIELAYKQRVEGVTQLVSFWQVKNEVCQCDARA